MVPVESELRLGPSPYIINMWCCLNSKGLYVGKDINVISSPLKNNRRGSVTISLLHTCVCGSCRFFVPCLVTIIGCILFL
jgi:hypothetical protein